MDKFSSMTPREIRAYAREHYSTITRLPSAAAMVKAMRQIEGTVMVIRFEVVDWQNGFSVSFEIPFSQWNWEAVFLIPGARDIRQAKA